MTHKDADLCQGEFSEELVAGDGTGNIAEHTVGHDLEDTVEYTIEDRVVVDRERSGRNWRRWGAAPGGKEAVTANGAKEGEEHEERRGEEEGSPEVGKK